MARIILPGTDGDTVMITVQNPATNTPGTPSPSKIQGQTLNSIAAISARAEFEGIQPCRRRGKVPYAGWESPEETAALKAQAASERRNAVGCARERSIMPAKSVTAAPEKVGKMRAGKTKNTIIAALLLRKSGTTGAEILAATNWPSVSVPGQAKAAGLKLRKEKVQGKPTRYFGSK